ncbi:MAG: hypothetical protein D6689_08770 [Deltaproteobacteria bacterium]|nr:MAG: hypothetical protein D6689_08770 [Deltaproteobacteria bacterium]
MRTDGLACVLGAARALAVAAVAATACRGDRPRKPVAPAGDARPVAVAPAPATPVREVAASTGTVGDLGRRPDREPPADEHSHDHAVDCPIDDPLDPDKALDEAAARYDTGEWEVALACTEVAVDLIPQSVEAHHLHAAALAALGRFGEAQTAFAMAIALDPDDPETLAAAADFHINAVTPKRRDSTLLGLAYARRGSDKASTRRRRDRDLRARLALLEGQALNDLGRADEALPRIDASLALAPRSLAARYERGVSLFNLCRFDAAYTDLAAVLERDPDDAYAHYHIGLIYERKGRPKAAAEHLARARALAPADFPPPVDVSPDAFRAEVDAAVAELPPDVRAVLGDVAVEVEDLPALDDLTAVDPPFSPTILGLFRGYPLGVTPPPDAGEPPPARAIVLYRKNLARAVRTREELDEQIRRTLLHEIGHLRGLDEDQLRRRGLE